VTFLAQKIILASSSPRRQELLASLNIPFSVHVSDFAEVIDYSIEPKEIVQKLAWEKAKKVKEKYKEGLIIGADTIVVIDKQILGKPKDKEDAFQMLNQLQGRTHTVFTGIAIIDANTNQTQKNFAQAFVTMKKLSEEEIWDYIATKEPLDKAGAYAIQRIGASFISQITGDYFAVVGLSIYLLSELLKQFGFNLLKQETLNLR